MSIGRLTLRRDAARPWAAASFLRGCIPAKIWVPVLLGLRVYEQVMTTPSASLSVHHRELVWGDEAVWGSADSTALGTCLSVLLSEVSLPLLFLFSSYPIP